MHTVTTRSTKRVKVEEMDRRRSGDRVPGRLAFAVWLIAFVVYLLSLSPGVSWAHHSEDSGDLITSAWVLGIPHPTGYPLFCILGWMWSHVVVIGSVAWRMNALSALWGSIAAGVMVRAVWVSFDLLSSEFQERITRFGRGLASVSAGLLLAFATDVWSLSIVTEVYSLNLLFVSLVSWIIFELLSGAKKSGSLAEDEFAAWKQRRYKLSVLLAVTWGLSLTNHLTSLFLFPGIALVLMQKENRPSGLSLIKLAGWFALPLILYSYLPIRSAMDPPLDWGNPENWSNFVWVVTGQQFKKLMFTLQPYQMLHQVVKYASIPSELGGIGALAAGCGVIRLLTEKNRYVTILMVWSMLLVASSFFYLASYAIWDPEGYILPMVWATVLWAGWAIIFLVSVPRKLVVAGKTVAVILLVLAPVTALTGHWQDVDLSGEMDAIRFGEESFANFDQNAVVIERRYERAFTLWYYGEVEYARTRDDVAIVFVEHATFDWGLDLLRRKYPDLVVPESVLSGAGNQSVTAAWIARHNIGERPVYSGYIIESLEEEGYRFEAVDLSYRLLPPENE